MTGAFLILAFTIVVGGILYIFELAWRRRHNGDTASSSAASTTSDTTDSPEQSSSPADEEGDAEECCGLHLVCEKDSLSPMDEEIIYYDDEELDRFIGRDPYNYSPEETDEFRDVLMTLRHADIPGWARSITLRRLELPPEVRDELLMLVNEQREQRRPSNAKGAE